MDQRLLAATCRIIVGPTGRRLPAYRNILEAYTKGLFRDYYRVNRTRSIKNYYKYTKEAVPYPHFLLRHYGGPKDYRRNLSDMLELVDDCPSIRLLCMIQAELYRWVSAYLPSSEAEEVCQNYVNQNPTRREIAVFLADILHFAIVRNPVENRSTAMKSDV